jgi:hypothetical protein
MAGGMTVGPPFGLARPGNDLMHQARFSGVMPQPERPPSWVDEHVAPPEEGGSANERESWAENLPRIRGSMDPNSPYWPRPPATLPDINSNMPHYDPFDVWDRGMGVLPWEHQNAPWRRPQGI